MNSNEVDILLVDDSQDDMDLTLHALRAENLANGVFVARDGEEALDFIFCSGPHSGRSFDRPPKLVLLDLKLPKVDGMQVLKQIKSDARTKVIPVVLMTSSKEERDLGDRLQPGRQQLYPEAGGLRRVPESGEAAGTVLAGHESASRNQRQAHARGAGEMSSAGIQLGKQDSAAAGG